MNGEIGIYEQVYTSYFKPLYIYAYSMVKDEVQAEEIVQNLFLKIWERREKIQIETSLKAYLYKAVYFDSLNHIKHLKVRTNYVNHTTHMMKNAHADNSVNPILYRNLDDKLRKALNELPEQCRTVFQMSRFEDLKYREIAARLLISEKTVENHMGKALRILRAKLAEFLVSMSGLYFYLKHWL